MHHIISMSFWDRIMGHDQQTFEQITKIFPSNSQVIETNWEYYINYGILFGVVMKIYRASWIGKYEIWLNRGNNSNQLWHFRDLLNFLYFLMYNMCMFDVFYFMKFTVAARCDWWQIMWHIVTKCHVSITKKDILVCDVTWLMTKLSVTFCDRMSQNVTLCDTCDIVTCHKCHILWPDVTKMWHLVTKCDLSRHTH